MPCLLESPFCFSCQNLLLSLCAQDRTKCCLPPDLEYLAEAYNGDMGHVMFVRQLHILADAAMETSECTQIEMVGP